NPTLRTQQQLKDARARIVVAPTHLADQFLATGLSVVALDPNWQTLANENARRPELKIAPTDLCAVLFTSGSTGRPKGVAIENRNLLNLLESEPEFLPLPGEGALQVCAPQFDVGAYEIWATLLSGGRLVWQPPGRPDPRSVCARIVEQGVTWAAMATGIFHQLVEHGPEPLAGIRLLLVGGEPLLPDSTRRL